MTKNLTVFLFLSSWGAFAADTTNIQALCLNGLTKIINYSPETSDISRDSAAKSIEQLSARIKEEQARAKPMDTHLKETESRPLIETVAGDGLAFHFQSAKPGDKPESLIKDSDEQAAILERLKRAEVAVRGGTSDSVFFTTNDPKEALDFLKGAPPKEKKTATTNNENNPTLSAGLPVNGRVTPVTPGANRREFLRKALTTVAGGISFYNLYNRDSAKITDINRKAFNSGVREDALNIKPTKLKDALILLESNKIKGLRNKIPQNIFDKYREEVFSLLDSEKLASINFRKDDLGDLKNNPSPEAKRLTELLENFLNESYEALKSKDDFDYSLDEIKLASDTSLDTYFMKKYGLFGIYPFKFRSTEYLSPTNPETVVTGVYAGVTGAAAVSVATYFAIGRMDRYLSNHLPDLKDIKVFFKNVLPRAKSRGKAIELMDIEKQIQTAIEEAISEKTTLPYQDLYFGLATPDGQHFDLVVSITKNNKNAPKVRLMAAHTTAPRTEWPRNLSDRVRFANGGAENAPNQRTPTESLEHLQNLKSNLFIKNNIIGSFIESLKPFEAIMRSIYSSHKKRPINSAEMFKIEKLFEKMDPENSDDLAKFRTIADDLARVRNTQ